MTHAWFAPWGWLYRPRSAAGIALTVAALAFMAQVFLAVDAHSHSVSDTLYAVYPYWGVTFLGWEWIARRTCKRVTG